MEMGFQSEQHRLGLWDLNWDLIKTISWEMGLGPPPLHDPHLNKDSCLSDISLIQHHFKVGYFIRMSVCDSQFDRLIDV